MSYVSAKVEPEEKKQTEEKKDNEVASKDETETDEADDSNLIQSTHIVQVKLADQQADPNSPLFSAKTFEELGLYVAGSGLV